ncbi:MAG: elongation factor P [Chloroflexi bacterium]|nr:elongation factor P [Chloroflexota bacterium]
MEISDVRKSTKLLIDGVPYNVDAVEFMKPGKGRAIYRLKIRNLLDSTTLDRTYHSGDKVDEVSITTLESQYLYKEADHYVFMDTKTFEQYLIDEPLLGDKKYFLKEGTLVMLSLMGDRPIDITIPNFVELKVTGAEMSTKTATISPQTKSAVLETGFNIEIPPFIKEGDVIKVDTRTGIYVERVETRK